MKPARKNRAPNLSTWEKLGGAGEAQGPHAVVREFLKQSEPRPRPPVASPRLGVPVWERAK